MNKDLKVTDNGGVAEEALREYFANLGAFVVRGIPVRSGNEDVTDADLWAYTRISANSNNVTIVDIKNKRRGKPFERVVWVKGLQTALRANDAIIATQGAKGSVYDFAQNLDVKVISGKLFDALVRRYADRQERYYSEELYHQWANCTLDRRSVKSIVDTAKSHFSYGISFAGLNSWIDESCELLRASSDREKVPGPLARAGYLIASFVAVGVDALSKRHAMSDYEMRAEYFRKGLVFGSNGAGAGRNFIDFAEALITEHLDATGASAAKVRSGFNRSIDKMPIEGLVENFSRSSSASDFFKGAIQLERTTFSRNIDMSTEWLGIEGKAILGLLADYAGIPRRNLIGDGGDSRSAKSTEPHAGDSGADVREPKLDL